jgi:hypothetical protein
MESRKLAVAWVGKLARAKSFCLGPRDKVHQERPVTVVKHEHPAGQTLGGSRIVKQLRYEKPDRARVVAYEKEVRLDQFQNLGLLVERAASSAKSIT